MKRSEAFLSVAKKCPALFRQLFTYSIRGYLPPIHEHWLLRMLACDLFATVGFPMRDCPYRLYVPRELHGVYFDFFDHMDYERVTSKAFKSQLKPGGVVIDVGANIGHYTLLGSAGVGPQGRVHAVECSPQTRSLLEANVQKNKLQNVEIHPFAASDTQGSLTLNITAIGLSWFNPHSQWPSVNGSGTTVTVPTMPLDAVVSSRVDLVKIDAEGADLEVLKGMRRILSENQEIAVIVEWAPLMLAEAGKDPLEMPKWLQEVGFANITVLDEFYHKERALQEAVGMFEDKRLPPGWVCDLFARKGSKSIN
jgi:FkbM family methyltransferase